MLDAELQEKINALARAIAKSKATGAFTGAGISTESGIPDFRGPQGIWKKMQPIELQEFLSDPTARREYWRRKIESYPQMRDAQANEGHRALARLHAAGRLQSLITQNIDSVWYFMTHPTANFL
jgi:NAD-dependent deacetylase